MHHFSLCAVMLWNPFVQPNSIFIWLQQAFTCSNTEKWLTGHAICSWKNSLILTVQHALGAILSTHHDAFWNPQKITAGSLSLWPAKYHKLYFHWVTKETTLHCYLLKAVSKSWQFVDAQAFFQSWLIMSKLACKISCGCVVRLWTLASLQIYQ